MLEDKLRRPLHDLRISVTDRCNFRCGYCMPKDVFGKGYPFLKSSTLLSYGEIERLVRIFASLGVEKIRLTGGEPLLRKDLETLVEKIHRVDGIRDIAITTNASLLSGRRAHLLKQAGVKRVNISLDALNPEIYRRINQVAFPMEDVLRGVDHALAAGFDAVKVNMVVQKEINVPDILPMVEYFRNTGVILRFIEFMDVGNHNRWRRDHVFGAGEIIDLIQSRYPIEPIDLDSRSEVAKRWRFIDGSGEIGVISSITQPFCNHCVRARLSAIGELFTCLFATRGTDLRGLLKAHDSDAVIRQRIQAVWRNREDQYSMQRSQSTATHPAHSHSHKVEMSYIGG